MKKVSLIIPTYNEAKNLPLFLEEVWGIVDKNEIDLEFIVVDDNSPDGTGAVAEDLKNSYPLKVLHRSGKLGLGSAVIAGFADSDREIVGVMDADLSHDPIIINDLITSLEDNDIVLGSRFNKESKVENWVWWRKIISNIGVFFTKLLTGVNDPLSGYFFLRKEVISGVKLDTVGYKILFEILVKGNWKKVKEIPFNFRMRKYSDSKLNSKEYFLFIKQIFGYSYFALFKKNKILFFSCFFAFLAIFFVSLRQSIWLDEGLSILFSRKSILEIINISASTDLHPPLYNLFLHFSGLVSQNIFFYRSWSLLFFILSVILMFNFLKRKKITESKYWLLVFLTSPFAFYYASEARSYSAVILFSLINFFSFDNFFTEKENKKLNSIIYVIGSIIGVYLFYPIIFLLIAEFLYVIFFKRQFLKSFFWSWVVIFISYLPWIIGVLLNRAGEKPGHFLSIPWWQIPAIIFIGFSGGRVAITDVNHLHWYWPTLFVSLVYFFCFLGLVFFLKNKENKDFIYRILFIFSIPIFICLYISATRFSVFDPRYYTELLPLFSLLLILSFQQVIKKSKRIHNLLFFSLLFANLLFAGLYILNPYLQREPWKNVVFELENQINSSTDAVIFIGYQQPPPTYLFYQTKSVKIISTYLTEDMDIYNYDYIDKYLTEEIGNKNRIWYSQFLEWQKDPEMKIRKLIEKDFDYKKTIGFFKVKFDLYERKK